MEMALPSPQTMNTMKRNFKSSFKKIILNYKSGVTAVTLIKNEKFSFKILFRIVTKSSPTLCSLSFLRFFSHGTYLMQNVQRQVSQIPRSIQNNEMEQIY